jgi:hypothetical protein
MATRTRRCHRCKTPLPSDVARLVRLLDTPPGRWPERTPPALRDLVQHVQWAAEDAPEAPAAEVFARGFRDWAGVAPEALPTAFAHIETDPPDEWF